MQKEKEEKDRGKQHKKLTAQPHARAGSMEVDGYENPEAENQEFYFSRGESNPRTLSIYDEAASDPTPIPLGQTLGVLCSLGEGG
jgi:hypothetical protein